jgi:hypothetical protein
VVALSGVAESQDVLEQSIERCEALSSASRNGLFNTLQDALKPVLGGMWPPKVVLDEAQAMLVDDFNLWKSTRATRKTIVGDVRVAHAPWSKDERLCLRHETVARNVQC